VPPVRIIEGMKGDPGLASRAQLESAVDRVGAVARALTSTTDGVTALRHEVVDTAAAIAGAGASAAMALRDGENLSVQVTNLHAGAFDMFPGWESTPAVLAGHRVHQTATGGGSLLVLPMSYQGAVVGALAVMRPRVAGADEDDPDGLLAILANNAAIAMENARLYETEKESVRRLRELDSMKTDFLSTVQHELRTPLTAILGLSDLIEMCWETWSDTPKLEALRDIQVAARNLDGIVETIIDFTVGDGETLVLGLADVPLEAAARAAIEVIGERHKGGLPVPAEVEVDPAVTLLADPDRLGQVLRALIDNAVKFSDGEGSVTVRGRRTAAGTVLVEVIDRGIGIPEADLPHVFDRFFQVDNTATRRFGGTGMGLALVKRVVEAHGASIDIETSVGAGTRVVLRWPERMAAPAETTEARPMASPLPVQ
jgi:signal transduction histidine kinase